MAETNGTAHGRPTPFDQFKDLTRKLVRVPKKEVDAKEAAYQRKKARRKARKSD
jgi:hypothetical protein